MKLRNIIISVLAMAGSLVSCDSADEAIKKAFKVDAAEVFFETAEASEYEVTLNAGYAWAAVVEKDAESWLSVKDGLGEGSSEVQSFHIMATKNTGEARSGVVTVVMSGTQPHKINVLQAGADGSLDVPETPDTPDDPKEPDIPGGPEPDAELLYMRPNANWNAENARFAAYFFGNGEIWVDMTDEDRDGCFECEKQEGYTSVIFCRMNPDAAENTWDNKWNQTGDLAVPVDDKICFVLNEGSWDTGEWTTYPPVATEPDTPSPNPTPEPENPGAVDKVIYLNAGGSSLWDQADAWFEAWSWGTGEGAWYTMTSAGAGIYQCTVPVSNDKIIFVRRGPNMTTGWTEGDNYWNKTDDLVIPDGSNCYTITGWGATDGKWSAQ